MDVFKRTESLITKRFLAIAIVALCCIPWTPCSSRPIFSPEESAGGSSNTRDEEGKSHNNASMVVRIIVSSSSSSSSSSSHHDDSDFSHLLIEEDNNTTNKSARSIEASLITPVSPQQWSSQKNQRLLIEPSMTASSSTIAPPFLIPITTYRPKLSYQVPIYTFSRPTTTTTTTTTTIKPLPFEENIFSVFYRAFSQHHDPASSLGISRTFQSDPRPKQPEVVTSSGSKNVETFQVFPNPRTVAQFRNPYRRHDSVKQQINKMDAAPSGDDAFESLKEKTVTSVVTRSSSSISTKLPTISAHYPRIRPSSVMMLSLKGVDKEVTPESATKAELIASDAAKMAENNNESDWSMKEILTASNPELLSIPEEKSEDAQRKQENFPRAEALIQDRPVEVNDVTKSSPNEKHNDSSIGPKVPTEIITETKEPESWSQPAKVWSEPAKVWGEPAKVWSQPAKVWSEPATTYRSIEPELIELATDTNSTEDIEAEDDSPQGTFYEIGEDEEEIPTGVPAELTRKSDHPHLPELTSQLDHSFLDPSSRSVEVAESIQVSLKHHTNNYHHPNRHPDPSKSSQTSSSSQEESTRNLQEQREKSAKKFGYILDGSDVRKYRVEERTPDGYIVGEYGILSDQHGFVRGVRYTADGTINPRLIHEALMKFLSL